MSDDACEGLTEEEKERFEEFQRLADKPYPGVLAPADHHDDGDPLAELITPDLLAAAGAGMVTMAIGYAAALNSVVVETPATWTQVLMVRNGEPLSVMAFLGLTGVFFLGIGLGARSQGDD